MPPATSRLTSYESPDCRAKAANKAGTPPTPSRLRSVTLSGRYPSTGDPAPAVKLLPTKRIVAAQATPGRPAIPSRNAAIPKRAIARRLRLDLDEGRRALRRIRADPQRQLRRLDLPLVAVAPQRERLGIQFEAHRLRFTRRERDSL